MCDTWTDDGHILSIIPAKGMDVKENKHVQYAKCDIWPGDQEM